MDSTLFKKQIKLKLQLKTYQSTKLHKKFT